MSKFMLYWQDNSTLGIFLSCTIVVILYVVISLLILFSIRRKYYDICVTAFIPVVNILQWVRYSIKYIKEEKEIKRLSRLETEEIELW